MYFCGNKLNITIMLSFTYLFNYGTLNIFKVQGNCILANRPTEFNNYILTDKSLSEVEFMTVDDVFHSVISVHIYRLISKYYNNKI